MRQREATENKIIDKLTDEDSVYYNVLRNSLNLNIRNKNDIQTDTTNSKKRKLLANYYQYAKLSKDVRINMPNICT